MTELYFNVNLMIDLFKVCLSVLQEFTALILRMLRIAFLNVEICVCCENLLSKVDPKILSKLTSFQLRIS